ncbi:Hypothetical predicted protein, partial [Paramuricea clavata]
VRNADEDIQERIKKKRNSEKGFFTLSFTEERLQSPTALNEKGNINGPERTARRKIQETSEVAMKVHGETSSNMQPAYFGLFATLSNGAAASTLTDMFYKSPTVMTKVIPNVVNERSRL